MRPEDCKEVFAKLSQYLDLELPEDACHDVEHHLEGCPPCIEFAESLRKTIDLCHHFEPSAMPAPLSEQARQDLRAAYQRMLAARKAV
jgi:RNA polymerase sigma-70 factor (ECF subfamily)